MEDKLITLAIHTEKKALILKEELEKANIPVFLECVKNEQPNDLSAGLKIRVNKNDLPRALAIVEGKRLFSYADSETYKIDDGRFRILVPVDFSKYSLNACQVAFNIAKMLDAKVKIFHVFYSPYFPSALPIAEAFDYKTENGKPLQTALDRARQNMENICASIDEKVAQGAFPPINYSYAIREGLADEEIANYAKEYKPVLIVMGTKGIDQNANFPLGSVTADVIETTSVPVLAIPAESTFKGPDTAKNIAFLTNFSQRDFLSFDIMVSLFKPYTDVRIVLTHIMSEKDKEVLQNETDNILKMQQYFSEKYPNLNIGHKIIDADDVIKGVETFLKEEKMDIVALNTRKRNILSRIFIPSMSRKLMINSNIALFVLRG